MFVSRPVLQRILGGLWLIDGLLQLQPRMFTMDMVNSVMTPMLESQPGPIGANLQWIIQQTILHLTTVNLLIAFVQLGLGLSLLFLSERWVKVVVLTSLVWALIVWYAGEGLSMLLTSQSSVLTGAPGAVILYPLLGLVIWPRSSPSEDRTARQEGLLPRRGLRKVLAGFWIFAALLQLQPIWWQPGHISRTIGAMVGQGGLNAVLIDPVLQRLSDATANGEIALNSIMMLLFLGLGIALAVIQDTQIRPVLMTSLTVSAVIWSVSQAFGGIFTGMATDFNSGLLLLVITLASFPLSPRQSKERAPLAQVVRHAQEADAVQATADAPVPVRAS